jgi:hypothetical protein
MPPHFWRSVSPVATLTISHKRNGLTNDDALDAITISRLYSADATRSAPSVKPPAPNAASETPYPPPAGATLNPLNRQDATKIHTKLRELGFYRANSSILWSAASRDALKEFKNRNDLVPILERTPYYANGKSRNAYNIV